MLFRTFDRDNIPYENDLGRTYTYILHRGKTEIAPGAHYLYYRNILSRIGRQKRRKVKGPRGECLTPRTQVTLTAGAHSKEILAARARTYLYYYHTHLRTAAKMWKKKVFFRRAPACLRSGRRACVGVESKTDDAQ